MRVAEFCRTKYCTLVACKDCPGNGLSEPGHITTEKLHHTAKETLHDIVRFYVKVAVQNDSDATQELAAS